MQYIIALCKMLYLDEKLRFKNEVYLLIPGSEAQ